MTRECGTCYACCEWHVIPELNKPARTLCPFLRTADHGCCTVYSIRPKTCSDYTCSWLRGNGADEDKPTHSNLLFDRRLTQFGHVLVAKQLKPGAAMTSEGSAIVKRVTQDEGLPCLIVDYADVEQVIGVAGPEDLRKEVENKMVDGIIRVGNGSDWMENIVTAAQEGRVFPGVLTDAG